MRKKSVIELISDYPYLFSDAVLQEIGCAPTEDTNKKTHKARAAFWFDNEKRFSCGEGWLPIIKAFAESLDEIAEKSIFKDEGKTVITSNIEIDGAIFKKNKLHIILKADDLNDIDEQKLSILQLFASNLSEKICEVCGSLAPQSADLHSNDLARCKICRFRLLEG